MSQLKVVFLEALKKSQVPQEDEKMRLMFQTIQIPENEILLVDEFLTQFTIISESSSMSTWI